MDKVAVVVCWTFGFPDFVSRASMVNWEVPRAVGVPEITPVDLFSLSPLGSFPAPGTNFQVYGAMPPEAVNPAV